MIIFGLPLLHSCVVCRLSQSIKRVTLQLDYIHPYCVNHQSNQTHCLLCQQCKFIQIRCYVLFLSFSYSWLPFVQIIDVLEFIPSHVVVCFALYPFLCEKAFISFKFFNPHYFSLLSYSNSFSHVHNQLILLNHLVSFACRWCLTMMVRYQNLHLYLLIIISYLILHGNEM